MNQTAPTSTASDDQKLLDTITQLQSEITELEKSKKDEEKEAQQKIIAKDKQVSSVTNVSQLKTTNFGPNDSSGQQLGQTLTGSNLNQVSATVSRDKERKDQIIGSSSPESAPIREISVEIKPPPELEQWIEPVPNAQTITLPKPVKDEYGEILLKATQVSKPKITLPLTEIEIQKALHHKVVDSIRWLAEWCKRNILLSPERTTYKQVEK